MRPVVMVADVTYNFCGDRPEPVPESIKRWRNSCGAEAWQSAGHIQILVGAAHDARVPVVCTTGTDYRPDPFDACRWAGKTSRFREPDPDEDARRRRRRGNHVVEQIAPVNAKCADVVLLAETVDYLAGLPKDHLFTDEFPVLGEQADRVGAAT